MKGKREKKLKNYVIVYLSSEYTPELEKYLLTLDGEDIEFAIYHHQKGTCFEPVNLLAEMERVCANQKDEVNFIFMTDCKKLMETVYRIYQQSFYSFMYYEDEAEEIVLPTIFEELATYKIEEKEQLIKPIYSSTEEVNFSDDRINNRVLLASYEGIREERENPNLQKYYYLNGQWHVFEPGAGKRVYCFKEGNLTEEKQIHYSIDEKIMSTMMERLEKSIAENDIEEVAEALDKFVDLKYIVYIQYKFILFIMKDRLDLCESKDIPLVEMVFYSYLLHSYIDAATYEQMLSAIERNKEALGEESLTYLYEHMSYLVFLHPNIKKDNMQLEEISKYITKLATERLQAFLEPIKKEEREKDTIIVTTSQFLGFAHAPTKTALERIYTLGKEMNKRVIVINTKEILSERGRIPIYGEISVNEKKMYDGVRILEYKDYVFQMYQPEGDALEDKEAVNILSLIRNLKPYFVIHIGGFSVMSELIGKILPVIHIPVVFTQPIMKTTGMLVLGKYYADYEKEKMRSLGYDVDSMIESTFTFELKEQKGKLTRRELGIPEDKFLLAVIGFRLTYDVTEEFMKAMCPLFEHNIHIVFAGEMDQYESMCKRIPSMREHTTYIGMCGDILALMENVDLYVNPKRLGGGFSIIEAFSHGKPGVTLNYGDVAGAAGPEFRVESYTEMTEVIKRYVTDPEFYEEMSIKARKRAEECQDSKKMLEKIINEAEMHERFF